MQLFKPENVSSPFVPTDIWKPRPEKEAVMSKGVMYLVAAVVFVGIGALVAGLSIWYHHPNLNKEPLVSEVILPNLT